MLRLIVCPNDLKIKKKLSKNDQLISKSGITPKNKKVKAEEIV
jgi:hypothetical protein